MINNMEITRRRLLLGSSVIVGSIAGCLGTQRVDTDIHIENNAPSNKTVELAVEELSGADIMYEDKIDVNKSEEKEINNEIATDDDLLVLINAGENLRNDYEWTNIEPTLNIHINSNNIEFKSVSSGQDTAHRLFNAI